MKRKVLFVTVLSVLFCGCNSYDYSGDDIMGAKAVIRGTISEATRTVGTTWIESDCIGVTCDNDVNIPYEYIESSLSFMASDEEQSIYLLGKQNHALSGYYPFMETSVMTDGWIAVETTAEKQIPDQQSTIDFLYATAEASRSNPLVDFDFNHQMTRVDFKFEGRDGLVLDDITYTLLGLKLQGAFNTIDGTTAIAENTLVQPLSQNIPVSQNMQTSLVLLPQETSEVAFQLTMGDKSYYKKMEEMDLRPGHIYTYTVGISQKNETIYVTIERGEVQKWIEGDRQEISTSNNANVTEVVSGASQWGTGDYQGIDSQDINK